MKKLTCLSMLVLLTITMAGCGKDDGAASNGTTAAPAQQSGETPQAMYEKAKEYYSGSKGMVDKAKAFELFSKAAAQGDSGAMFFVGVMYETGEAGEQNDQKALEWFEKSDKAGCGAAAEWITKMKKKMKK